MNLESGFEQLSESRNCSSGRDAQLLRISYYEAIMQELGDALREEATSAEALKNLQAKADELTEGREDILVLLSNQVKPKLWPI